MSKEHLVIGDCQVTPDCPTDHLEWIGKYIVDIKPDVVVHLGDFADMESLSSYDKGKKSAEGRRVQNDIDASDAAFDKLNAPLIKYNKRLAKNKKKQYKPRKVLTLGNHEYRITRHVEANAELEGFLSTDSLNYKSHGWEVHDFLDVVEIDGIHYSHYFIQPMTGRAIAGMMETRIKNIGFSFTHGHQQGFKTGERHLNNGIRQRGLVLGSTYLHNEAYLGQQGNHYYRGIVVKHEVKNGDYDLMEVSLNYLCKKYEQMSLNNFLKEKYGYTLGVR